MDKFLTLVLCKRMYLRIVFFDYLFGKCKFVTLLFWLIYFDPLDVNKTIGDGLDG